MAPLRKNKGVAWAGGTRTVRRVTENPMGRALKRGFDLGQFQEQLNSTADLLKNYRECDGKGDAKLIEDIIKDAESCWSGSMAGGKWNQVTLCHGAEAGSGKMMSMLGDFSINSALFLSFTTPYLFEGTDAVNEADQGVQIAFQVLLWCSVACHLATVLFMIYVTTLCNCWAREADFLKAVHRHGEKIEMIPMWTFIMGIVCFVGAIAVAQVTLYNSVYIAFAIAATLFVVVLATGMGETILMQFDGVDSDGFPNSIWLAARFNNKLKTASGEPDVGNIKRIADVLDTPIDVLRKQHKLAKVLDDDSWRQSAMRSSIADSNSDDLDESGGAAAGITMSAMHASEKKSTEEDASEDAVAAMAKVLEAISPELGEYAEMFVSEKLTPELLGCLAADSQLCMQLGMKVGHALVLKANLKV